MQFEKAYEYIINELSNHLPNNLHYHNLDHTKDVYKASKALASLEKLNAYETELLLTAAGYHDAGFIECNIGHELVSCEMASKFLPLFGYDEIEVKHICDIILATKVPQKPKDHLGQILCDADLDYLGRDDYFKISNNLFLELSIFGEVQSRNDWNKMQVAFLKNHHYFTFSAINLRQNKKEENLQKIKAQLIS